MKLSLLLKICWLASIVVVLTALNAEAGVRCPRAVVPTTTKKITTTAKLTSTAKVTTTLKKTTTTTKKPTTTTKKTTTTTKKPTTTTKKTTTTTKKTTTTTKKPTTTTSVKVTTNTAVATPTPASGFVYRSGTQFMLNGCKFYFEGVNNYYMTYSGNSSATQLLDYAKAQNIKVMRVWAFIDGESKANIVYQTFNPQKFYDDNLKTLDSLVFEASKRSIKLILVLTNNWAEFGGINAYLKAYNGVYHDDFFSSATIKAAFKNWMSYLANRQNAYSKLLYKNDPAIFAWELINEIRCRNSGSYPVSSKCNIALTTSWVSEMGSYLKSIDSNHMVGVGDEGLLNNGGSSWPYRGTEGVDSAKFLALSCIDFGTAHLYPDNWGFSAAATFGVQWIADHASLAVSNKKPMILEEYGIQSQSQRVNIYNQWHNAVLSNNLAGSMIWMYALSPSIPDYDGYTVYATGGNATNSAVSLLGSITNSLNVKSTC